MNVSFGARLRLEREQRGVALSEISHQTKIKVSLLEALERDDLSYWPHGLFGRAYIRAYAQAIHLDPDPVVREYLERHPDPADEFAVDETTFQGSAMSSTARLWRAVASAVGGAPPPREQARSAAATRSEAPAASRSSDAAPPFAAVARLCTQVQQAKSAIDLVPVLSDMGRLLEASGIVLWSWDSSVGALQPWLTHGYAPQVVEHLPRVRRDEDNAIASAFRSMSPRVVCGRGGQTGAIVVPVVASNRSVGALSLELGDGREQRASICDTATIFAAVLARFIEEVPFAAVVNA